MRLEELKTANFHIAQLECHRQSWAEGSRWLGYQKTPRPNDAVVLICSDMQMLFEPEGKKPFTARKGDVVFIPQGTKYAVSFLHVSGNCDSYTVNFLLSDEQGLPFSLGNGMGVLQGPWQKECLLATEEFFKAYINRHAERLPVFARFYDLLDILCRMDSKKSRYYYPIQKGVAQLLKEWDQNRPIEEYAAMCDTDRSYFYKLFKAWSGVSPHEYRIRLRMAVAASKLQGTTSPIKDIAIELGFEDPYYFSRLFKQHFGLSPRHYRNQKHLSHI